MAEIKWTNVNDVGANAAMGNYLDAQKQFQYQIGNIGKGLVDFTNTMNEGHKSVNRKIINDNTQTAINEMLQINDTAGYEAYKQSGAGLAENVLSRFGGMIDLDKFNEARSKLEQGIYNRAHNLDLSKDYNLSTKSAIEAYNIARATGDVEGMRKAQEAMIKSGASNNMINSVGNTSYSTFDKERENIKYNAELTGRIQGEVSKLDNQIAIAQQNLESLRAKHLEESTVPSNIVDSLSDVQQAQLAVQQAIAARNAYREGANKQLEMLNLNENKISEYSSPINNNNNNNNNNTVAQQVLNKSNNISVQPTSINKQNQTTEPQKPEENFTIDFSNPNWGNILVDSGKNLEAGIPTQKQINDNKLSMENVNNRVLNDYITKVQEKGIDSLSPDERKIFNYHLVHNLFKGDAEKAQEFLHNLTVRQQTAGLGKNAKVTNRTFIEEEENKISQTYLTESLNIEYPTYTFNKDGDMTISPLNIAIKSVKSGSDLEARKELHKLTRAQSENEGVIDDGVGIYNHYIKDPKLIKKVETALAKFDKLPNQYKDVLNANMLLGIYKELSTSYAGGLAQDGELSDKFYEDFDNIVDTITNNPKEVIQQHNDYLKLKTSLQTEIQNPIFKALLFSDVQQLANSEKLTFVPEERHIEALRKSGRLPQSIDIKGSKERLNMLFKNFLTPSQEFSKTWESKNGKIKTSNFSLDDSSNSFGMPAISLENYEGNARKRAKLHQDWNEFIKNSRTNLSEEQQQLLLTVLPTLTENHQKQFLEKVFGYSFKDK